MKLYLVALAVALGAVLAPAALADQPAKTPLGNTDFTIAAGGSCDFAVHFAFYGDKEIVKTFSDGRLLITGSLRAIVSNLSPRGRSLDLNISGPVSVKDNADGTTTAVLLGRSAFQFFPTDPVGRGLLLTSGRMTLIFDAAGNVLSRSISGTVVDICAALS